MNNNYDNNNSNNNNDNNMNSNNNHDNNMNSNNYNYNNNNNDTDNDNNNNYKSCNDNYDINKKNSKKFWSIMMMFASTLTIFHLRLLKIFCHTRQLLVFSSRKSMKWTG